ncbi:MAG TPA: N-acetyltransferase [Geobacterales bacterium]|nr:N-acetyltransferase [Geobacterales bacterium]
MENETIFVREVKREDIPTVVEINRRALPENYSIDYFYYHLEEFPDLFLVGIVKRDDLEYIAGYSMSRIEFGFSNFGLSLVKKGHLISIAVLDQFRRKGIASSLIKTTIERLTKKKVNEFYLEVRVTNYPAISLYKKFNFVVTNKIPSYYSDGEDAYVMTVKLR